MYYGGSNAVFTKLGHQCVLPEEEQVIQLKYPGHSFRDVFCRWFFHLFIVSEHICLQTSTHLKSHYAIVHEKKRQLDLYPFRIHPHSRFRLYRQYFMLVLNLIQLVITPMDAMCFYLPTKYPLISSLEFRAIRMTLDLVCVVDFLLNFVTAFYDSHTKETAFEYGRIFKHFLGVRFIIGVLTTIPSHWELIFTNLDPLGTTATILHGVGLLKALRYLEIERTITRICNIHGVNFFTREIIILIVAIPLFWYVSTSAYLFAVLHLSKTKSKFVENLDSDSTIQPLALIIQQLYLGAVLIHNVDRGFKNAFTIGDMVCRVVFFISSRVLISYILARVIEYINAKTASRKKYDHMVQLLLELMRHKQLPMFTQKRIMEFYQFHYHKHYYSEKQIMASISKQLRQEIVVQKCRQLVENVVFFKNLPLNMLITITSILQSEFYMVNDLICKAKSRGDSMYFIASGTVAIYSFHGSEICHLHDGDFFGEVALISNNSVRAGTVVAVETCQLYRLDRKDFLRVIKPYPDLYEAIVRVAAQRQEDALQFDARWNKRNLVSFQPADKESDGSGGSAVSDLARKLSEQRSSSIARVSLSSGSGSL